MDRSLPLISVIVPVYNIAQYLPECVDSILGQTYPNTEIILVDDGSTDESGSICDEYAERFPNVVAVHQKNRGLSGARNGGIEVATGEYYAFIDSDDYISPVFLEALYRQIDEHGCLMATVRHGVSFYDGHEPRLAQTIDEAADATLETEVEYQTELLYQKSWNGSVWRLCHRDLIEDGMFPEGLLFEDLATTYKMVRKAGPVAVLDSTELYAYRQRDTGIMRRSYSQEKTASCIAVTQQVYSDICTWYPELEAAVSSRCFAVNRVIFSQVPVSMKADRDVLWQELKKFRGVVLSDPCARKREKIAATFASMGKTAFTAFCKGYRKVLHSQ